MNIALFQEIAEHFGITSKVESVHEIKAGHINETYHVVFKNNLDLVFQKINTYVFKEAKSVMHNIELVTSFLKKKGLSKRNLLLFLKANDGNYFHIDEKGNFWRVEEFIDDATAYNKTDDLKIIKEIGYAFGNFQTQLKDFPSAKLKETIKDFHNTNVRYQQLKDAAIVNFENRLDSCQEVYEQFLSLEEDACAMMRMQKAGELPLRVTHNDTKSNNALIDNMTDRALAVIDLDTIMPGLAGFDFGDMIRYGANNAEEDEKDLSKVFIRLDFFEQYARGFIKATKKSLTKKEIETLPLGAFTMTVECGTRFLADYLQGDLYFKTDYPEHNLDRAKNQLALALSMMDNEETLHQIIREAYSHY